MSSTVLSTALYNALHGLNPTVTDPTALASLQSACNAIATAVVSHVTAFATVSVTGTATGVTAGAATVPVVGTGTVA